MERLKWLHVRDRDRDKRCRTAMFDTIGRQTYSESYFFDGRFDTELFLHLISLLTVCSQNDWLPVSLVIILFSERSHISFHFSIQVIHFHSPLFTQVQYPVYKIHNNQLPKVNM